MAGGANGIEAHECGLGDFSSASAQTEEQGYQGKQFHSIAARLFTKPDF
jgi:hypothetical protein